MNLFAAVVFTIAALLMLIAAGGLATTIIKDKDVPWFIKLVMVVMVLLVLVLAQEIVISCVWRNTLTHW